MVLEVLDNLKRKKILNFCKKDSVLVKSVLVLVWRIRAWLK